MTINYGEEFYNKWSTEARCISEAALYAKLRERLQLLELRYRCDAVSARTLGEPIHADLYDEFAASITHEISRVEQW